MEKTPYSFQARCMKWILAWLNTNLVWNKQERNQRFLEEALELVQSLDMDIITAHRLVDYVFNRPSGEPKQELGGVMNTLAIPIAPQPTPIVDGSGPGPHYVADMLSQFVASVWHLLDNSETSGPIDDPITIVMQSDFDEVSKWLDRFESLSSGSTSHLSAAELVAAYLSQQPVAVMVKPLVWDDHGEAKGGGVKYLVYEVRDGWNCTCYPYDDDHYRVATAVPELLAKAAAQADYEARILSALTIHPADFDPLGR